MKGATDFEYDTDGVVVVSIHAPVKGATAPQEAMVLSHHVSIHAPVKGATDR